MTFDIRGIEETLDSTDLKARDLYDIFELRRPVPDPGMQDKDRRSRGLTQQIPWIQASVELALNFMEKALEHEEFLLVCDVAREALRHWKGANPEDGAGLVKVRMNYARALTRLGYTEKARDELEPCAGEEFRRQLSKQQRVDIFLQLGEIMREESQHATTRPVRLRKAERARHFYGRALEIDPSRLDLLALTASASMILGDSELRKAAHARAQEILTLTRNLEDTEGPRWKATWARATAFTILGDIEAANRSYGQLQSMKDVTTKWLADTRYKTRFLADALGMRRDLFDGAFPPLQLIVFSGHVPDLPGKSGRFPVQSVEQVREMLRRKLQELDARVGIVCAAAGADLLFIEALRARQGSVHLVLPWARDEFRQTSVRKFEPPGAPPVWEPLFDKALQEAATVREMGDHYIPSSKETWQYTMEVTAGLALHTARVSRLDVHPLVLWDKLPGWNPGGTASFVNFWRQHLRQEAEIIVLPPLQSPDAPLVDRGPDRRCESSMMHQEVKSMLFADIVGYSKLSENAIPEFVETFMHRVSLLAARSKHAPSYINTWGDAVYAVFDFASDAGSFAIELTQMIQQGEKDWLKKDLYWEEQRGDGAEPKKHTLSIRIGLHTGPVFIHYDPVVRRIGFTGAHASRAARIEPVARPGEVFASEEFAALATLDTEIRGRNSAAAQPDNLAFACEYAGSMQLAKDYPGRFRVYRVLPKPVLAVEELAGLAHESTCAQDMANSEKPKVSSSMGPLETVLEDLEKSNRAQPEENPTGQEIRRGQTLDSPQCH